MDNEQWFAGSVIPVRDDLAQAFGDFWERLARPGTWWTGAERVAMAAEVRAARSCAFCRTRRAALSPASVSGVHDVAAGSSDVLSEASIDAVHRLTEDCSRSSSVFIAELERAGVDDAQYVELLGIVVSTLSIDEFCRGIGVPNQPLPEVQPGEPSRRRPDTAKLDGAYVPMLPPSRPKGENADLWPGRAPNVIRAMSLVPDAVRDLTALSGVMYIAMDQAPDMSIGRSISRSQIELVAGRVSALNECFY